MKKLTAVFMICIGIFSSSRAAVFTVTNTQDSGAGSLRQARADARFSAGADTIIFEIPTTDPGYQAENGIWVIQPLTYLLMSSDSVFVDGASQARFQASDTNPEGPEIVIDGSLCTNDSGILIENACIHIHHLVVYGFTSACIAVSGDRCVISGCYIGTGHDGQHQTSRASSMGIWITFSEGATIGGDLETDRNIISGHQLYGIEINRSRSNHICNNYIGLNAAGTDTVCNTTGIHMIDTQSNTIGPGNVISGNTRNGIRFESETSDSNTVIGNLIGTDMNGTSAIPNQHDGISIMSGDHNIIGSLTADLRNIISGNTGDGVFMYNADSNYVAGNFMGTGSDGLTVIPNENSGLRINNGAGNQIGGLDAGAGNLLSGNGLNGFHLTGSRAENNHFSGNRVGTDAGGTSALPNSGQALFITGSAGSNTIGPENIIAFSPSEGIYMQNSNTLQNTLTKNSLHSNTGKAIRLHSGANLELAPPSFTASGTVRGTTVPNAIVEFFSTPDDEALTFEGSVVADGTGNFQWDGTPAGPYLTATATDPDGNTSELSEPRFAGRTVVTNTADAGSGSLRWALEAANINAGSDTIHFDIPETDAGFNGTVWVIQPLQPLPVLEDSATVLDGPSQTRNQRNTNPDGPEIMLDGRQCIPDDNGLDIRSSFNIVKGFIISGFNDGILISYQSAHHNQILGNYIGTSASGTDTIPNMTGIRISFCRGQNIIGGATSADRNLISGNRHNGIYLTDTQENTIIGNRIGTTRDGLVPMGNGFYGVYINYAQKNMIGGLDTDAGNLISCSGYSGVCITGSSCRNNIIKGNLIGTDLLQNNLFSNGWSGIRITHGASRNIVGGEAPGEGNVICGDDHGIEIEGADSDSNNIAGNFIGTDRTGSRALGNRLNGVMIHNGARHNQTGPGNIICASGQNGVEVSNEGSTQNTITQNSIFGNENNGIELWGGGNTMLAAPVITALNPLTGTAVPNSTVEIFSDSISQGRIYEGSVTADAAGNFTWNDAVTGPRITATATDAAGNTSPFSRPHLQAGLTVTHTGDDGENSLRWAIEQANDMPGPDTIHFDIPETDINFDGTVWWISPLSALPAITDSGTVIHGFSQTNTRGQTNPVGPEIALNGSQITTYENGITVTANRCEVNGLIIGGFKYRGISVQRADRAVIRGNYIGTTPSGSDTLPNDIGIHLRGSHHIIGGTQATDRNLISGNSSDGIFVESASNIQIYGNFVGTDLTGTFALPNGLTGICLSHNTVHTVIGGSAPGERNLISGNGRNGIRIEGTGSFENQVSGNYIGTDSSGTQAVENKWRGVYISNWAHHNLIGGPSFEQGNLISGNRFAGILISGAQTDSNVVQYNFIGTDASGQHAMGNQSGGVEIAYGANRNQIIDNIISGNMDSGLEIRSTGSDSNRVERNFIGPDKPGTASLPNYIGLKVTQMARHNIIHDNIISGNTYEGIVVTGDSTFFNEITSNWIGLNITGQDTLPNGGTGIIVGEGADHTRIGGSTAESNVIAACGISGIYVRDDTTSHLHISHNLIGTDATGTLAFGNNSHGINLCGRHHAVEHNLISANLGSGIKMYDFAEDIQIRHNLIGVQADSIFPLANQHAGVWIEDDVISSTVGPDNRIWHNTGYGIQVWDSTNYKITITENSMTQNGLGGILLMDGANRAITAPEILSESPLTGSAPPDCRIEIFSDTTGQGREFLGWTQSDGQGAWSWEGETGKTSITATATDADGNTSEFSNPRTVSVEKELKAELPDAFYLSQNYPNPFNPVTTIVYGLPEAEEVTLKVYDLLGRELMTLVNKNQKPGSYSVTFDARGLASGLYLYRIEAGSFTQIRKMAVVK